jgi:general secretion pathway protein D
VCLVAAAVLLAGEPTAASLYRQGRKAERSGDVVRAYLLYSEAAAKDPARPEYHNRAQALEIRAALKAHAMPAMGSSGRVSLEAPAPPAGSSARITEEELAELRRMRPPPELKPLAGRKSLDLSGNAKALFEQATAAFGLGVAFDAEYEPGSTIRLHLDDVDYRQALRAVEAATGSFVFPIGQRLVMVAKETPQNRREKEPTIAVTVPIPDALSPQEVQEVGRAVQQAFDIAKLQVDTERRMVLMRDRISRVRPAQALFEQLAHSRAQVMLELQFVEVDRSQLLSYGLLMPRQFPISFVGAAGLASANSGNPLLAAAAAALGNAIPLAKVVNLSPAMFGVGIANAQLFATMTNSSSRTLLDSELRSLDGETASFHVGDKYPVLSGTLLGGATTGTTAGSALPVAPAFNFEDLGLVLKVTPHVHGAEEVSLDVAAEFKVLTGGSANGIPVIASRKIESKVRVREGEWALVAGLMSVSDAKSIASVPGVSRLPLIGRALRENDRNRSDTEVLLLLRPILLDAPPDASSTRELWVGSEARPQIPL